MRAYKGKSSGIAEPLDRGCLGVHPAVQALHLQRPLRGMVSAFTCTMSGSVGTPQYDVPGGLVGGPRAYRDQLLGFMSHRAHARRDFLA